LVDLSKCQCEKPGLCPVFTRVMGSDPPNWQWCQKAGVEDRRAFFNITSKSLPDYYGAKIEEIDFSTCRCHGGGLCPIFNQDASKNSKHWLWCQSAKEEERMSYYKDLGTVRNSLRNAINRGKVDPVEFKDVLPKPKSKYAVCVIPATESAVRLLNFTKQGIVNYAESCGADYIELTGDQSPDWPMANKYRLHQVTALYDKTLYLDCDVIINSNAPNIFLTTPDDKISAYDEWQSWNSVSDTRWILNQQETIAHKLLDKKLRDQYINNGKFCSNSMLNGGVLVIPRDLRDYYKQPDVSYPRSWCFDQNYLTLLLPKSKLYKLDHRFNCAYTDKDFYSKYKGSYFIHINNLSQDSSKREWLLNTILNGDDIDSEIMNHLDISTSKKYDLCDKGVEAQKTSNIKLKEFIKTQTGPRYTINDVSILCLGHSEAQFSSIRNRPYLKKVNLNNIDAGKYSGNEWAESRIYFSKNSIFKPDAEFYGIVTASWSFKYYNDAKIENFHNWPSTKILLSSKPEDKVVLCADLFCWCKWVDAKSCSYGAPIIDSIIDPKACDNKAIVNRFLDSVGFDRGVHKRVPYSNQMICHKSVYQNLVQDIYKHKVPEKIQDIMSYINKLPKDKKRIWDYCHIRVPAYLMELYTVSWFMMRDCRFISNTTRKEDWYNLDKISDRLKKWK